MLSKIILFLPIIFGILPVLFHILGIYLLHKTNSIQENQILYLTNISVVEILFMICQNIPLALRLYEINILIFEYVAIAYLSMLRIPWYNIMMALTVDRLLEVFLNIRYSQYMTTKKTKVILFLCWFSGVIFFTIFALIKYNSNMDVFKVCYFYAMQIYNIFVIVIILTTYIYFYSRIRIARRIDARRSNGFSRSRQLRRRHFVPFWILSTFVLLYLLPSQIFWVKTFVNKRQKSDTGVMIIMMLIMDISGLADVLIYIFMNSSIKLSLKKFLKRLVQIP